MKSWSWWFLIALFILSCEAFSPTRFLQLNSDANSNPTAVSVLQSDVDKAKKTIDARVSAKLKGPDEAAQLSSWKDGVAKALNVMGSQKSDTTTGDKLVIVHNGRLVDKTVPHPVTDSKATYQVNVNSGSGRIPVFNALTDCPLSQDLATPFPQKLSVCHEFRKNSCCSVDEEKEVTRILNDAYGVVYGECPGCVDNFRRMLCGVYCSPLQKKFVSPKPSKPSDVPGASVRGASSDAVVRVCQPFCDNLYSSCKETTLGAKYHSEESFCQPQLDTLSGIWIELSKANPKSSTCLDVEKGYSMCSLTPEEVEVEKEMELGGPEVEETEEVEKEKEEKEKEEEEEESNTNTSLIVKIALTTLSVISLAVGVFFLYKMWKPTDVMQDSDSPSPNYLNSLETWLLVTGAQSKGGNGDNDAKMGDDGKPVLNDDGNGYYCIAAAGHEERNIVPDCVERSIFYRSDPKKGDEGREATRFCLCNGRREYQLPGTVGYTGPAIVKLKIKSVTNMIPGHKTYAEVHVDKIGNGDSSNFGATLMDKESREWWVTRYTLVKEDGIAVFDDELMFEVSDIENLEVTLVLRDWTDKRNRRNDFPHHRHLDKELIGSTYPFPLLDQSGRPRSKGEEAVYAYWESRDENEKESSRMLSFDCSIAFMGKTIEKGEEAGVAFSDDVLQKGLKKRDILYAVPETNSYFSEEWKWLRTNPVSGSPPTVVMLKKICCIEFQTMNKGRPRYLTANLFLHVAPDNRGRHIIVPSIAYGTQGEEETCVSISLDENNDEKLRGSIGRQRLNEYVQLKASNQVQNGGKEYTFEIHYIEDGAPRTYNVRIEEDSATGAETVTLSEESLEISRFHSITRLVVNRYGHLEEGKTKFFGKVAPGNESEIVHPSSVGVGAINMIGNDDDDDDDADNSDNNVTDETKSEEEKYNDAVSSGRDHIIL
eukprot:g5352.t1